MTNPLTGDHDAVLQVSVGTLNRLLAGMHQNEAKTDPALPCLPHSAFVRVGDDPAKRVDGVHGVARVQLGVPKLDLIHLAQDRVNLQVVLRVQTTTSSGSAPFPEFVHGTLRARYVLRELGQVGTPPTGASLVETGPSAYHPPRFHFDVDPASVVFTSFGDTSKDAAITRQAVGLLSTAFTMPGGHPVVPLIMDRKLITLAAPGGAQCVAIGFELGPDVPKTEQPRQISRILTGGRDIAIAVSVEFVKSLVQPHLDALQTSTTTTIHFDLFFTSVDYVVDVTSTSLSWALDTFTVGGVTAPCGALDLAIEGTATTTSVLPNIPFTIRDRFLLVFSPATEILGVVPKGEPSVQAQVGGVGPAESAVEAEIAKHYKQYRNRALNAAFQFLAGTMSPGNLVQLQLQTTDDAATVTMDSAEFSMDGVVLRGSASLSRRASGVVLIAPLGDLSGYSAFHSWLPGGRIDSFEWRWLIPHTDPDVTLARVVRDRFAFQPAEGMPGLPTPSGLDPEGGHVCLIIEGTVIDPVSGAEVRAFNRDCYTAPDPPVIVLFPVVLTDSAPGEEAPRLWVRVGSDPEMGISEAGRAARGRAPCNTLLYLLARGDAARGLDAIVDGMDQAERDDAGLQLLAVVPEGQLAGGGAAGVRNRRSQREVSVSVIEDIEGGWARRFAADLDAGESLRLITADGRVAWIHDGPIEASTLASALREHLTPSDPPDLTPPLPGPAIGRAVPRLGPPRLDDEGVISSRLDQPMTLCFALGWARSSQAELRRLDALAAEEARLVVVVLTDASSAEAAEAQRLAPRVLVVPDPDRTITDQYDIWMWPTSLTLDPNGTVVGVTVGNHESDDGKPVGAQMSGVESD